MTEKFARREVLQRRYLFPLKSWTGIHKEPLDRQGDEIWLTDEEFDILLDHPFSRRAEEMREDFNIVPLNHWYRPSINRERKLAEKTRAIMKSIHPS